METFELNLGPLNDCIDYLDSTALVQCVTPPSRSLVFHDYMYPIIIINDFDNPLIAIPTQDVIVSMDGEDTNANRRKLSIKLALEILHIIHHIVDTSTLDIEAIPELMVIPVKGPLQFYIENNVLCILVNIGIAFFVK